MSSRACACRFCRGKELIGELRHPLGSDLPSTLTPIAQLRRTSRFSRITNQAQTVGQVHPSHKATGGKPSLLPFHFPHSTFHSSSYPWCQSPREENKLVGFGAESGEADGNSLEELCQGCAIEKRKAGRSPLCRARSNHSCKPLKSIFRSREQP